MIQSVKIANYKSIADLDLPLGRINVLIGENGAGKSNILEAITFAAAASRNKLDNEFLVTRGIRVVKPVFMRSAFESESTNNPIQITILDDEQKQLIAFLQNENGVYSEWENLILNVFKNEAKQTFDKVIEETTDKDKDLQNSLYKNLIVKSDEIISNSVTKAFSEIIPEFVHFLIYSPEESSIRQFEREGQIQPLGRNGEGLLKLISTMYEEGDESRINELKENLRLVSWFEDFDFSSKPFERDMYLKIKDKYIDQELDLLDQRSSNEGFLYLLFYLTLFISDKTPKFFAIDNIDNALNPKLCIQLMKVLTKLAKKHDKQVLFTTHNPAILDGLDISDPEQKLLVVSRKRNGETKVSEVDEKPKSGLKLSESFMSGLLGGLPKNF